MGLDKFVCWNCAFGIIHVIMVLLILSSGFETGGQVLWEVLFVCGHFLLMVRGKELK